MQRFILLTILSFTITGMLITSCKKEAVSSYINDPAIYLTGNGDSVRYSFAIRPSSVVQDTIWLNARISGDSTPAARAVNLTAVDGATTAIKDVNYKLPGAFVPANKFTARIPIVVYRTPDLLSKEVVIALRLNSSDGMKASFTNSVSFRILLNDILTKPTNWESALAIRFGVYSQVKYKFMIDVLGSDIILKLSGSVPINDLFYYKQKVLNAWNDYVALHGPQVDENGLAVVFP